MLFSRVYEGVHFSEETKLFRKVLDPGKSSKLFHRKCMFSKNRTGNVIHNLKGVDYVLA